MRVRIRKGVNTVKAYSKFLDILEKVEKVLIAAALIVMIFAMTDQVVMRYVFSKANSWSDELTRYLFIYTVMLGSAIAVRRNSHLQIDLIIGRMKPKSKAIFNIVVTIIGIVFLAALTMYSFALCEQGATNTSAGLGITMNIPYMAVPIGCILMILTSIEVLFENIAALKTGEEVQYK